MCCVTWRLPCFRSVWWFWTAAWEVWTAGITSAALTTDGICLCVCPSRFVNYKRCEMGNCSPAVATIILSVRVLSQRARATNHWVVQCTHTLRPQARLKEVLCVHTWQRNARPFVIISQAESVYGIVFWDISKEMQVSTEMMAHATMMSSGKTGVGSSTVLSSCLLPLLEINHTPVTRFFLQIWRFHHSFLMWSLKMFIERVIVMRSRIGASTLTPI